MALPRLRQEDDLPAAVLALEAVHEADGYPMTWPADAAAWLSPDGVLTAWVVESDPFVAGHVCLVTGDDAAAVAAGVPAERVATVSRLFVAPWARRRGLSVVLLDAVTSCASTRGLQLVLDVVDDRGPAVRLYDRLGWRLVDRRPADWTAPDGNRPPLLVFVAPPPGRASHPLSQRRSGHDAASGSVVA